MTKKSAIEQLIEIPSRGSMSPEDELSNEPLTPPSINDPNRMRILGEITPVPNCTIV